MNKKIIVMSVCLLFLHNKLQSSGPAIPMVSQGGVQQRRRDLHSPVNVMPGETIVQAIVRSRRELLTRVGNIFISNRSFERSRPRLILRLRPNRIIIRTRPDEKPLRYQQLSLKDQEGLFGAVAFDHEEKCLLDANGDRLEIREEEIKKEIEEQQKQEVVVR